MSVPMLKYFVMGINLFFDIKNRECIVCGNKTARLDTRFCELHLSLFSRNERVKIIKDSIFKIAKPRKNKLNYTILNNYREIDRKYKIPFSLRKTKLHDKEYLVYDPDTMEIIGFR